MRVTAAHHRAPPRTTAHHRASPRITMLLKLPDILTADELRAVRALLDAAAWDDGRSIVGE